MTNAVLYNRNPAKAAATTTTLLDEFWIILQGKFKFDIEDEEPTVGEQGDIIFIEKGKPHKMTCIGNEIGIRLACGERDMSHIYL